MAIALVIVQFRIASGALGQAKAQLIDASTPCGTCRLLLSHITTLGSLDKVVGSTVYLPSDGYSRYYVAADNDRGHITVYDRRGEIVRKIGRQGSGPGEFSGIIRPFMGPRNTIYVVDNLAMRLTVFDTTGHYVRQVTPPRAIYHVGVFSDGSFAVNADFRTAVSIGYPLHYLSADGKVIRSFGPSNSARAPGLPWRMWPLAIVDDSLFWAANEADYVLELWNVRTGKVLETLRREVGWFPKDAGRSDIDPTHPPKPFIQALRVDQEGRIWVLILLADTRWKANIVRAGSGREGVFYNVQSPRVWDSIIEAIDPRTGRLIISERFDPFIRGFTRNQVFSYREDDVGTPLIDVWNLELITNGRHE